jgi:hypothetical protein
MAISVSTLPRGKFKNGDKRMVLADVTFTGSYATGGEAVSATVDIGVKNILNVDGIVTEAAGQTTAWAVHWDRANGKLKLFGAGTGATGLTEHAAAAYATSTVGHLIFWCL